MKKIQILILTIGCLFFLMGAAGPPEVFFQMQDPIGDEHGPGNYQYPSNIAFRPYQGLFDIQEFKVWSERPGLVYFDTTFGKITNPWMAPEGFIHQNLRIFIDSVPKHGLTNLPQRGAKVSFNPKNAWDLCLKVVGWGNSRFLTVENDGLKNYPLQTELLGDGRTIRATLPESSIGKPTKSWRYYVMVGSYDGFGEDFFRKVATTPGEWVIGGGADQLIEPRLLDILAPVKGPFNQMKQLRSFDPKTGKFAELNPVGLKENYLNIISWFFVFTVFLMIGALIYLFYQKAYSICWFWIKKKDK